MGTLSSGPICFGLRSVNRDLFIWCFVLSLMLMGWGGFYLASTRLTKNRSDDLKGLFARDDFTVPLRDRTHPDVSSCDRLFSGIRLPIEVGTPVRGMASDR